MDDTHLLLLFTGILIGVIIGSVNTLIPPFLPKLREALIKFKEKRRIKKLKVNSLQEVQTAQPKPPEKVNSSSSLFRRISETITPDQEPEDQQEDEQPINHGNEGRQEINWETPVTWGAPPYLTAEFRTLVSQQQSAVFEMGFSPNALGISVSTLTTTCSGDSTLEPPEKIYEKPTVQQLVKPSYIDCKDPRCRTNNDLSKCYCDKCEKRLDEIKWWEAIELKLNDALSRKWVKKYVNSLI